MFNGPKGIFPSQVPNEFIAPKRTAAALMPNAKATSKNPSRDNCGNRASVNMRTSIPPNAAANAIPPLINQRVALLSILIRLIKTPALPLPRFITSSNTRLLLSRVQFSFSVCVTKPIQSEDRYRNLGPLVNSGGSFIPLCLLSQREFEPRGSCWYTWYCCSTA
jgi:hypothetical protein